MDIHDPHFIPFLLRAKKNTYAASGAAASGAGDGGRVDPSRPASHDLRYQEGDWLYLDTYLGGFAFAGEEAVWYQGQPLWSMNYYGTMTVETFPDGFSPFLKHALLQPPSEAPYRGPAEFQQGRFTYACRWEGSPTAFRGEETIAFDGQVIYRLDFHGGQIIQ